MADDLNARWVKERARLGLEPSELAKALDVTPEAVRLWEKGTRAINAQNLAKAYRLGFDIRYVLSGTKEKRDTAQVAQPEAVQIPLRDVYASSGPGGEAVDEAIIRHLAFDPFFVESWGIPPERVEAVISRGDSNEPTIRDGAVVLIDRGDRKLREKPMFAFRTPDGVRLKRFQKLIDGSARLVSDNQALYAPEVIGPADLEQLRVVGRAFWTGMEI
ncbi:MAG: XRE family transcriptional regulator [Rhabdaerophilum sp.]